MVNKVVVSNSAEFNSGCQEGKQECKVEMRLHGRVLEHSSSAIYRKDTQRAVSFKQKLQNLAQLKKRAWPALLVGLNVFSYGALAVFCISTSLRLECFSALELHQENIFIPLYQMKCFLSVLSFLFLKTYIFAWTWISVRSAQLAGQNPGSWGVGCFHGSFLNVMIGI